MFKKIISVFYIYYSRSRFDNAYFASILLVAALQQVWLITLLEFIKRVYHKEMTLFNDNVYYVIPVSIVWAFILFKIFPKQNVLKYVEEFKKESKNNRLFWAVLSLTIIAVPLFTIVFYF